MSDTPRPRTVTITEQLSVVGVGCQAGFCDITGKAIGMHTNVSCRCLSTVGDPNYRSRLRQAFGLLRDEIGRLASLPDAPTPDAMTRDEEQEYLNKIHADGFAAGVGAAVRVVEGGSFLHDQAPTALFAKECADAIRRIKTPDAPPSLPPADKSAKVAIPDAEPVADTDAFLAKRLFDTLGLNAHVAATVIRIVRDEDARMLGLARAICGPRAAPERDEPEAG